MKHWKKIILSILIGMIAFLSGGCYDAMDINEKTLVMTVVTDRQANEFVFHIEIPDLSAGQSQQGGGSAGKDRYIVLTGKGRSYADARRELTSKAEKPIFLGTVQALIITDELARYGIEEYVHRLQADYEYRKALHIVTTFKSPDEILSVRTSGGESIGRTISSLINTLVHQKKITMYSVSEVLEFLSSKTCFVLSNLDLREGSLAYNGYTIFHEGKYHGFISVEEARGLIWLTGVEVDRLYTVPFAEHEATLGVKMRKRVINPVYRDGSLKLNIKLDLDAEVRYLSSQTVLDEDKLDEIKETLKRTIKDEIAQTIERSKASRCEYFQIVDIFRTKYPNEAREIDYLQAYLNSEVDIEVTSTLEMGGMMDFSVSPEG